jgi:hypothetical protein
MTDHDRIEALFTEGRITREQADELLHVLSGLEEETATDPAAPPEPPAPQDPPAPAGYAKPAEPDEPSEPAEPVGPKRPVEPDEAAGSTAGPAREAATSAATTALRPADKGQKWLELDLLAGNVRVQVDPGASEPMYRGEYRLEHTKDGMRIAQEGQGFLEGVLGGARTNDLDLRLPADWALRLNVKAGNVDITGPLRQLAGRVHAGDVDIEEVHAIDLRLSAGNLRTGLLLQPGKHRISSSAGNLHAKLLPGSSVTVDGRVQLGGIKADMPLEYTQRGLGATAHGRIGQGDGEAELKLRLSAGDLRIGWQNA